MNKPLEITFDEADKNLFQVDDPRLRADALQHSVLPRLHVLLNQCVALVGQIYEIDPFQDSIVSYFPHFRPRRSRELRLLYHSAYVSLGGKRTKNRWHGFQRKDGKPVQIVPFRLGIALRFDGLSLMLEHWPMHLTDDSYRKLLQFHLDFEGLTHRLCYASGFCPHVFHGDSLEPLSSFREHYEFMCANRLFDNSFHSQRPWSYPITANTTRAIAQSYATFYSVYDAYLQIAKNAPSRFTEFVQKANLWLRSIDEQAGVDDYEASHPAIEPHAARQAAEQRIRVMPALRWQVFQRDDWRCVACGRDSAAGVILHVDHIIPRSRGGQDTLANYQTLCHLCNIGKSNRDETDLRNHVRDKRT